MSLLLHSPPSTLKRPLPHARLASSAAVYHEHCIRQKDLSICCLRSSRHMTNSLERKQAILWRCGPELFIQLDTTATRVSALRAASITSQRVRTNRPRFVYRPSASPTSAPNAAQLLHPYVSRAHHCPLSQTSAAPVVLWPSLPCLFRPCRVWFRLTLLRLGPCSPTLSSSHYTHASCSLRSPHL